MARAIPTRSFVCIVAAVVCSLGCKQKASDSAPAASSAGPSTPKPFVRQRVLDELRPKYPQISLPKDDLPAAVTAEENVVYVRRGEQSLALDLYRPAPGATPAPALIVVHGGGWETGDRMMERPFAKHLAARGFASATVDYRLGPAGRFPGALHDLKAAVRFLRANAERFGIDPARIGAVGGSAGGQLVALLGASNGIRELEGDTSPISSAVQAVVDIDGLADFTGRALLDKEAKDPGAPTRFLGGPEPARRAVWEQASAIHHASASTPPTLFINSTAPKPILPGRSEMCDKLKRLDVPCAVVVIPDTPHPFWLFEPWFTRTVDETAQFLEAHLPALLSADQTVLILSKLSENLGAFDPTSGKRRGKTLPLAPIPHEMALSSDEKLLYVSNYGVARYTETLQGANRISIVDLSRKAKAGEIELGEFYRPHGIELGHSGKLYVTVDFPPAVLVIDPRARRILRAHRLDQKLPHMLVVTKDEKLVYAANSGSGTVSAISLQGAGEAPKHVEIGGTPMGLALSADESRLYAANRHGNAVVVVDTRSLSVSGRVEVPGEPVRLARVPGRRLLIATLIVAGDAVLIDTESLRVTERLHVGRRLEGLFVDPKGRFAFMSAQEDNQVALLTVPALAKVLTIATDERPDPMVVVSKELEFSGHFNANTTVLT